MPTPKTPAEAWSRLVFQLGRDERPDAQALARTLARCRPDRPCRSAACPVCGEAFQQVAVAAVDHFVRTPARARLRGRISAITIIPASGVVQPEDLTVGVFQHVAAEIKATIAALRLPPSIIGLEVSFNEDLTGEVPPHWCGHGHLLELDWLPAQKKKALRAAFPASDWVKRPVFIEELDDNIRGRMYPFKRERVRRETYLDDRHSDRAPFRATRRRGLRPWQAVSLALVEHELGFERRLLNHGIGEGAFNRLFRGLNWPRDGP